MRVLHAYSGNLYGGIERFLVTLAAHRGAATQMEPLFALCFDGQLSRELAEVGAQVALLGEARASRPLSILRARSVLRRRLIAEPVDAVVCHSAWPMALLGGEARLLRVPVILFLHDVVRGRWFNRWARFVGPDGVVCNSRHVAQSAAPYFNVEPSVASCAVPRPVAVKSRSEVRSALGASESAVVILQTSRLERWKGHQLLIDSLQLLAGDPTWECWIAGGPQRPAENHYLDELRAQARTAGIGGRVKFLGQRRDIADLLAAADIHCQPNTGVEPLGIGFVEAMHSGLPVVTTNLGGIADVVPSTAGAQVQPTATAVGEALRRFIASSEERAKCGAAGRAWAEARFSPAVCIPVLAQAVQSAMRVQTSLVRGLA